MNPNTTKMVPATISQCGYSIDEKAFVISLRLPASSTSRRATCGSGAEPTCFRATRSLPSASRDDQNDQADENDDSGNDEADNGDSGSGGGDESDDSGEGGDD